MQFLNQFFIIIILAVKFEAWNKLCQMSVHCLCGTILLIILIVMIIITIITMTIIIRTTLNLQQIAIRSGAYSTFVPWDIRGCDMWVSSNGSVMSSQLLMGLVALIRTVYIYITWYGLHLQLLTNKLKTRSHPHPLCMTLEEERQKHSSISQVLGLLAATTSR